MCAAALNAAGVTGPVASGWPALATPTSRSTNSDSTRSSGESSSMMPISRSAVPSRSGVASPGPVARNRSVTPGASRRVRGVSSAWSSAA